MALQEVAHLILDTAGAKSSNMLGSGGKYKKTRASQTPVTYVSTNNRDATLRKVKQRGGRMLMPKQETGT